MAERFPKSSFIGFDIHDSRSRSAGSAPSGLTNVRFETARGEGLSPGRASTSSPSSTPSTTWAIRSARPPRSGDAEARRHLDDRGADGRRTPQGQPQPGRPGLLRLLDHGLHAGVASARKWALALGAQAGEKRLRDVVREGGFTRFRRAGDAVQHGARSPALGSASRGVRTPGRSPSRERWRRRREPRCRGARSPTARKTPPPPGST